MQALIDGDLVVYRCAASAEKDGEEISVLRTDRLMRDIIAAVEADSYRVFLTGSDNFRKQIDPEYKANRTDPKPIHLEKTREFLCTEWKAEVQDGIEADDGMGINQAETTIICSLDKDMLQIPGKHYRWEIGTSKWTKPAEYLEISYMEGLRSFYASSLIGDKIDNIFGVDGIGKVKAEKALRGLEDEQSMFNVCRSLYNNDDRFLRNLKLLWILREEGDIFDPVKREIVFDI